MSDKDKIEYLLKLIKDNKFDLDLAGAHALVTSYSWLLAEYKKIEE